MPIHMAEARRRELAETPGLTLDGRPARIGGVLRPFATVHDTADPARSAEYSWQAVERVVTRSAGAFRS